MIHAIIGGALAGKTTYVRATYLKGPLSHQKESGIPVTRCGDVRVVGNYTSSIRCCGVDQMGRDQKTIRLKLIAWLAQESTPDTLIVLEGTALQHDSFFEGLKLLQGVKLIYITSASTAIAERAKRLKIKWIDILYMTHRKAHTTYYKWRKEFEHEIVYQHPKL